MVTVFIVVQTLECMDDGFTIEAVFDTKDKAIEYIRKEHPMVHMDTDYFGNLDDTSYTDDTGDRFTSYRNYAIHEFELR